MSIKAQPSFYKQVSLNNPVYEDVRQILVVSDLHLSEGYSPEAFHWNRRENFIADTAFTCFLQRKSNNARRQKSRLWLIINGDFIDFLRITSTPKSEGDLEEWRQTLKGITCAKLSDQMQRVLKAFDEFAQLWRTCVLDSQQPKWKWPRGIRDEVRYGLKTHDFRSIYRLMMVKKGHPAIFQALAKWLADGHLLTIISGNHDQELNQDLMQAGFLWMLEEVCKLENQSANFSGLFGFEKHGLEIDGKIRIEHSHRFEWYTQTRDQWLDVKHQEIFLPPGSLFNRYLLNRVEIEVPYLDNVKPSTRVIGYLAKHHPIRFLKMLGRLIETVYRLACKRGPERLILAGFLTVAQYGLPLLYLSWILVMLLSLDGKSLSDIWHGFRIFGISFPLYVAIPFFILYFLLISWLVEKLQLSFSEEDAKEKMSSEFDPAYGDETHYAICGHTHNPDMQRWGNNIIYINSGTWSPVFEYEGGHVRDDLTMTFVELNKNASEWTAKLARWEPLSNREIEVILVESHRKRGLF